MRNRNIVLLAGLALVLAAVLLVGCGGAGSGQRRLSGGSASVVIFGEDAPPPNCDVESFVATITSASLVPQSGGTAVSLITSAAPATVDFARLTDFSNILSMASVAPGTYTQFTMTLSNPQLYVLNAATSPPTAQSVPVTLTANSLTLTISPALVVTGTTTSGLVMDFDLGQSLQVNSSGQITGTVNPQITVAASTNVGATVGEATSLYGIIGTPGTANIPSGFTGSFPLALHDGTGQTMTILVNSSTVFDGDGATGFSGLTPATFAEVDAIVNTSGQIIAQTVDSEEQTSTINSKSAFLGKIVSVTRVAGNVTSFTLLVDDEIPDLSSTIPLESELNVTLEGTVHYFTNWQGWNVQDFTFGPATLGVAEKVAVFGTLQAGSTLDADHIFLRPRSVLGNFTALQVAGSDGVTGGFTMTPCGSLFGGQAMTVVTYSDTNFNGVSGLTGLTATPTIDTTGVLFYLQTSGRAATGATWTAPDWVMQARGVHQLPN